MKACTRFQRKSLQSTIHYRRRRSPCRTAKSIISRCRSDPLEAGGALKSFALRYCCAARSFFSDDYASLSMTICERCGTENLGGSRYCDECGAALWLTGNEGEVSKGGPQGNGSQPNGSGALARREPSLAYATLAIERGSSAGKQFLLIEKDANIGRWDADGGIFPDVDLDSDDPEAKVSRRHARISLNDGQYLIEDLGSTNGTFVNRGRRLAPGTRYPIKDGDEIIVGKTFLRFRVLR